MALDWADKSNGETLTAEEVNKIAHAVQATEQNQYSASPKQVGVWTTGMPVWRVAIDRELTEEDIADGAFSATYPCVNTDEDVYFIVNGRGYLTNTPASIIDYLDCTLTSDGLFEWDAERQAISGYTHFVGWIEFVTPEGNLK